MLSIHQLKEIINSMKDPHNHRTFEENGAIKDLSIDETTLKVHLTLGLAKKDTEEAKSLRNDLIRLIKIDYGFNGVKIDFVDLTPKEQGTIFDPNKKVKYIGIASGKGGVGKSTLSANIAVSLARLGHKVALIDADVYGPSLPSIFGMPLEIPDANTDEKAIPFKKYGVELMSTAFLTGDNKPLVWRGPMLNQMLDILFFQVAWSPDLEFAIIDLPPGTGDIAMDIQKIIPQCDMVIVTTPHPTAATIAQKAGESAKMLHHRVLGVIENMAYYPNPINKQPEFIFGKGGGQAVANQLGVSLLGQVPIGQPAHDHSIYSLADEQGKAVFEITTKLLQLLEK